MKTFLQSAIDCENSSSRLTPNQPNITNTEQWEITKTYLYSKYDEGANRMTKEQSVYFLLMIAADLGEIDD